MSDANQHPRPATFTCEWLAMWRSSGFMGDWYLTNKKILWSHFFLDGDIFPSIPRIDASVQTVTFEVPIEAIRGSRGKQGKRGTCFVWKRPLYGAKSPLVDSRSLNWRSTGHTPGIAGWHNWLKKVEGCKFKVVARNWAIGARLIFENKNSVTTLYRISFMDAKAKTANFPCLECCNSSKRDTWWSSHCNGYNYKAM